jgi:hypothetical protein
VFAAAMPDKISIYNNYYKKLIINHKTKNPQKHWGHLPGGEATLGM